MIVDSPTTTRMILASRNGNTTEVGLWKTTDSGLTWAKGPTILTASGTSGDGLLIGTLVQNFTPEGLIVVSERVSPQNLYRKMILLGMDGPVKRPEAEASQIKELLKANENSGANPVDAWSAKRKMKEAQGKLPVTNPPP